jgi:hypothetical protein
MPSAVMNIICGPRGALQYGISSPPMRPLLSGNEAESSRIAATSSPVALPSSEPARRRPSAE